MIICSKCGAKNTDDSLFCSTCGNKLEEPQMVPCANCGKMLKADAKFCSQCGSSVGSNLNILFTPTNNSNNPEPTELLVEEPQQPQQPSPMDVFNAEPQYEATELLVEPVEESKPEVPAVPEIIEEKVIEQPSPMDVFNAEPQHDATEILAPDEDDLPVNPVNNDVMAMFDEGKPAQSKYEATEILTEPDMPVQPQQSQQPQQSNPMDIFNDLPQHDATEILVDNGGPSFTPPVEISNDNHYEYSQVQTPVADTVASEGKKKKKKKSKAPIVIVVILIILAVLGAGGYYAYSQGLLDGVIEKITGNKSDDKDKDDEEQEEELTLDGLELPSIPDMTYTGSEIVPVFNLSLDGESLTEGEDYIIECTNNVYAGTASIVITGAGDITGSVSGQFNIVYGNELLENADNVAMVNYIIGLYSNIWGRNPSLSELITDCTDIRNGNIAMDAYVLGFFNDSEFSSMTNSLTLPEGYAGTREDYVIDYAVNNCLYLGILGRNADEAGLEYWSGVVREQGIYPAAQALLTDVNVVAQINAIVGV